MKDKSNQAQIQEVIQKSQYCHLSCSLENTPYLIPIAYGYDGEHLFFHTGQEGKKIEIFQENPQVCLAFEYDVKVIPNPDSACKWDFNYQSVIMDGSVEEVVEPDQKVYGLNQIMDHYSSKDWNFPPEKVIKTRIWKVVPESITYKKSP